MTTKGSQKREIIVPVTNFKQKKKALIEQLRHRNALRDVVEDENECVGPQNHMSRASKVKFIAAATTLDHKWLPSVRELSREQFMLKTLLLSLQINGRLTKHISDD